MNPWIPHLLRASSGGGGAVLPPAGRTMLAKLTSSLILDEGTGGPTWSRATKAWGFNELGYLEELASGCAFFGGARLVRNFIRNSALDNAVWTNTGLTITAGQTDYLGGTSAFLLMETAATSNHDIRDDAVSPGSGRVMIISVVAKANGRDQIRITDNAWGTISATFNLSSETAVSTIGTSTITSLGGGYYKCIAKTSGSLANNPFYPRIYIYNGNISYAGDITKGVILSHVQVSSVTGYDASYIPEYVPVDVEASPYFGAGIDGAKYFETDWQGAPIAAANLLGFRRESAATNNLLYSRDLTRSVNGLTGWNGTQAGSEILGPVSALNARSSISSGTAPFTVTCISTNGSYGVSFVGLTVGKTYEITCTISVNASGKIIYVDVGVSNITISASTGARSFQRVCTGSTTFSLYIIDGVVGESFTISAISIKEAAVQTTAATGLDGIANTATTLTATAADAIILQPITLASAARCASAYVRRRTGTGVVSFTQDGGSTWTDITSLINSSTWSRVEITATLANPSVGFKISTSGDAIDVDCAQNEAGAVATSPIVTTTAAVTRNADSLTYQTASNIDFAVGTIYGELQCSGSAVSRFAVEVGSATFQLSTPDANTDFRAYDTTLTAIKTGLSDITTGSRKRVVSWGPAGLSVTGDGLSPTTVAFDGSYGSGATVSIGRNINGYIGPVAIYNYQMTDAELQALTT